MNEHQTQSLQLPETFAKTIKRFFPELGNAINAIDDPRMLNKTVYDLSVLVWMGIFCFFFKIGASRNLNYTIGYYSESHFLDNFKLLFSVLGIDSSSINLERMPDFQTLIYLMEKLEPEILEEVIIKMLQNLLRKKVFESERLLDTWYTLAIDGTQIVTFDEKHCEHCLKRKIGEDENGEKIYQYYHYMVSVSLVNPKGFCIPVLTEFVENETQEVSKQDCELKAFYRLAPKLKAYFPRTQICLLLDGLFACKSVMDICEKNHWKFITVFKEGSIPSLYKEYKALQSECSDNRGSHILDAHTRQDYVWVNDLYYEGHTVSAIDCIETKPGKKGAVCTTIFTTITNIPIDEQNFKNISKGGRCRWNQENQGFNTQKTGGYNLEHLYARDHLAYKNFISLLLIGFTISQLIEKGSLIQNIQKSFGSFKNFFRKMLNAFTEHLWNNDFIRCLDTRYQIRLDSS